MAQQVQELIDKIKNEGVQAAESKAKEIESQAHTKAQNIISDAEAQAAHIVTQAQSEAQKMQESAQKALQQASRDTLLALRKEIERTLEGLISKEVSGSLTAEQLAEIISQVASKTVGSKTDTEIQVTVSSKDLKKLTDGFVAKLQKQVKQPIKFQSSSDIAAGFTISYDEGKSSFDFTDESLVNYLSSYLNEQISSILKKSI